MKPFLGAEWDGSLNQENEVFVTAIGAGTTYPDYKPAPLASIMMMPMLSPLSRKPFFHIAG